LTPKQNLEKESFPFIGKLHLTCLKVLPQTKFPFLTINYLVNVGLQPLTFTAKSLIMTFLVLLLSSSPFPPNYFRFLTVGLLCQWLIDWSSC